MPRFLRRPALLLAAASSALAAPPKLTVQLDWVAEPEHGAFYTAEALGYFKQEGLDVTLLQGGPNTYVQAKVATGRVELGQDDSTNSLLAIQAGAPLVNIAAIFQHDPSVLMMQEKNPVSDWKDLNGKTIMARPEWAFLPYLRDKYHLQFKVIPQNFDLGRLAVDPQFIQQGYYIAEPYFLEQKGIQLKFLKCWDSGFDAYATLITNRKFAQAHGDELRAFLRALQRGWKTYLEGDPGPAHAIMLRINPKVSAGYLDWSRKQIIAAHLARDEDGNYLTITPARFQREISQLENLKILEPGKVKAEQAMDASFLPSL
ncbi:MAG TPA: ABC transporter substrate-binding protein [Opitutaceae bacterium]|jgi:NitT/TauT family transport system substrate-binding protein|nr:ABC transporter substrate-binding protein [Opitutaceae bacterium]